MYVLKKMQDGYVDMVRWASLLLTVMCIIVVCSC